ncbi:hypothetical protein H671_2g6441 [Cricetulus griseus]|nr:hypothetical protein H671_2g6441 [Cricetulus griseus]
MRRLFSSVQRSERTLGTHVTMRMLSVAALRWKTNCKTQEVSKTYKILEAPPCDHITNHDSFFLTPKFLTKN